MDRFADAGIEVEACNVDGEWRSGVTKEPAMTHQEHRCLSVCVIYPDGKEEYVSMGRIITPSDSSSSSSDLTRHRGSSAHDLFERFKEQEKGNALARGKDYCKPFVKSVCIGGVRFLAGDKRNRSRATDTEREEEERQAKRQQQEMTEKQAKLAAI